MKVIDLLNKIANGEEVPKKIKYNGEIFTLRDEKDDYANDNIWFTDRFCFLELNDEIEIIEEEKKIPEKLEPITIYGATISSLRNELQTTNTRFENTINEIIDYLDYLKSKGE